MRINISLNNSYIRARLIGIILVIFGVVILFIPNDLNIKISFTLILIGIFMIFIITEKSISKKISDAQVEGNIDIITNIIKELNLNGNAVFLPKSITLNEERILIPPNELGVIRIPKTVFNKVFLKDKKGENLGISIPSPGVKLLNEIEKNKKFKNIEEKLQLLVGMGLLKSINLKKQKEGWNLQVEKFKSLNGLNNIENQFPCPACSAAITVITREFDQIIRIYKVYKNGNKIVYHLNFLRNK